MRYQQGGDDPLEKIAAISQLYSTFSRPQELAQQQQQEQRSNALQMMSLLMGDQRATADRALQERQLGQTGDLENRRLQEAIASRGASEHHMGAQEAFDQQQLGAQQAHWNQEASQQKAALELQRNNGVMGFLGDLQHNGVPLAQLAPFAKGSSAEQGFNELEQQNIKRGVAETQPQVQALYKNVGDQSKLHAALGALQQANPEGFNNLDWTKLNQGQPGDAINMNDPHRGPVLSDIPRGMITDVKNTGVHIANMGTRVGNIFRSLMGAQPVPDRPDYNMYSTQPQKLQ